MKKPNRTKPNSRRGHNVTGAHLDRRMYGQRAIAKVLPSLVAESVPSLAKPDRRRKNCTECDMPHLKGSDKCAKHDTGERPKTRRSD